MFGFKGKKESLGDAICEMNGKFLEICQLHFLFLHTDNMNAFIDVFEDHLISAAKKYKEICNARENSDKNNIKEVMKWNDQLIEAFLTFHGLPEKHNVDEMLKFIHTHRKSILKKIPENSIAINNFVQIYEFYESLNLIHALYTKGEAHASTTK